MCSSRRRRSISEERCDAHAPPDVMAPDGARETVDPGAVFRCVPTFETASATLRWITERVFLGNGVRRPSDVVMRFFEVM